METARKCLEAGKVALCESLSVLLCAQTEELIRLAEEKRPSFNGRYGHFSFPVPSGA